MIDHPPDQTSEQRQARALGDPTRHRIFQQIMSSDEPLGVAELTAEFGFNHNAIRQHLAVLREAGLVVEERISGGSPGRPRLQYRPHPEIVGRWGTGGAFEMLSHLVLDVVATGTTAREVGRNAGARHFAELRNDEQRSSDAVTMLLEYQTRGGFRPHVEPTSNGFEIVMARCPYLSAAAKDPHTVCQLHFGMAQGFVAAMQTGLAVTGIEPHDPEIAGCRLHLQETRNETSTVMNESSIPAGAVVVDARPILAEGNEPFATIMAAVATLPKDGTLIVIAPFEPVPLERTLAKQGFTWATTVLETGDWQVAFRRESP